MYLFGLKRGVWGAVTSSVDWCEPNYAHTRLVAELFNTASSLALVALGEFGVHMNHATHWKQALGFRMLSVAGVAELLFHMSLKHSTQMLAEAAMAWTGALVLSMCLAFHCKKLPPWADPSLGAVTLLGTLVTSFSPGSFKATLFRAMFACFGVAASAIMAIHLSRLPPKSPMRGVAGIGVGSMLLGALCWFADKYRCKQLLRLSVNPQLHAAWHVLAAVGMYHILVFCVHLHKAKFDTLSSSLHHKFKWIPYLKRSTLSRKK